MCSVKDAGGGGGGGGDGGPLPVETVAKCYGKPISAKCDAHHLIRVVSATYLRSRDCVGGASDLPLLGGAGNDSLTSGCSRDNASGPPCVGNASCIFTAPWIYISANCGYSNYFSLQYQCVPGRNLHCFFFKKTSVQSNLTRGRIDLMPGETRIVLPLPVGDKDPHLI